MSLQYIIDAYNLTNHPAFKPTCRSSLNIQQTLADFIKFHKLSGSKNNSVILVFDGHPPRIEDIPEAHWLVCVFSRAKEADELIREIVQDSPCPANIVVVSDDKEVQITSRLFGAQVSGVEKFISSKKAHSLAGTTSQGGADFKLSYAKMQKINAELKKRWL